MINAEASGDARDPAEASVKISSCDDGLWVKMVTGVMIRDVFLTCRHLFGFGVDGKYCTIQSPGFTEVHRFDF